MNESPETSIENDEESGGLLMLALLACVAGAGTGLLAAVFRLSLEGADRFRDQAVAWSYRYGTAGLVLILVGTAGATGVSAWLVRRFAPRAKGSGIPHVEAVLRGEQRPAPPMLILVKFLGGVLSMGSGLALGREGPSVQMGASLATIVGKLFRRNNADVLALLAAGAGSGLATAFNAPVAGSIFILEEVVRRFDTRHTITTLGASACAIAISRLVLGDKPDFIVAEVPGPSSALIPAFVLLGILCGVLGVAYNKTILGALALQDRLKVWPVEIRAAVIGGGVGLLAWIDPHLVGGGDVISQRSLDGGEPVGMLLLIAAVRFVLGPVSYSAATPGGLFAPLLVIGTQGGIVFGLLWEHWFPEMSLSPTAYGMVGMAAFFTAVVRAPLTGIVLITEMTASSTLLLPILAACFSAMVVPTLVRNAPIYDALREPAEEMNCDRPAEPAGQFNGTIVP